MMAERGAPRVAMLPDAMLDAIRALVGDGQAGNTAAAFLLAEVDRLYQEQRDWQEHLRVRHKTLCDYPAQFTMPLPDDVA